MMMIRTRISKISHWSADPYHLAIVLVGMLIALIFTFAWDIRQYSNNQNQQLQITALRNRNATADLSAYKTCILTKPKNTEFIMAFEDFYSKAAHNVSKLLAHTSHSNVALYKSRLQSEHDDLVLASTLRGLLPIKCQPPDGS